jgi:hypothetical protein
VSELRMQYQFVAVEGMEKDEIERGEGNRETEKL